MEQIEIHIDPAAIEEQLTPLLEEAIAHFGLVIRMRGPCAPILALSIGTSTNRGREVL